MKKVTVSRHAERRVKERVGVGRRGVERMAERAMERGLKHGDVTGGLRSYLDAVYLRYGTANNMRVWAEKVWIFCDDTLVTVLQLPLEFRRRR